MATRSSFTPPAVPECPYAPRMTRAQALALRTAGTLKENCVVVITDGPTIGNGTTSPTEIELNPVSPTAFGLAARVFTTFPSAAGEAWQGLYDIDLGTAGSIIELRDNFNNVVTDKDADSPTVHTQWPWHRGSATFSGNVVDDMVLAGWDTFAGTLTVTDNVMRNSTITLTGATSATISITNNSIQSSSTINLTNKTGNYTANGNLYHQHTQTMPGGNDTFTACKFRVATFNHTGTGAFTSTDSSFENFSSVSHTGTTNLTTTGSKVSGSISGGGTAVIVHAATVGNTSIIDSEIIGGNTSGFNGVVVNEGTAGSGNTVSIINTKLLAYGGGAATIRKQATSTGTIGIQASILKGKCVIDMTPTAIAAGGTQITILGCDLTISSVSNNGGAVILGQSTIESSVIQSLVGSVRILNMTACLVQNVVIQNSQIAGGTGQAIIQNSRISGTGTTAIDLQAGPAGAGSWLLLDASEISNGGRLVSSSTAVPGFVVQNSQITNGALLTMSAGASSLLRGRIAGNANITSGAFAHTDLVIEGVFTKTLTAANVNRLANKGFDDTL